MSVDVRSQLSEHAFNLHCGKMSGTVGKLGVAVVVVVRRNPFVCQVPEIPFVCQVPALQRQRREVPWLHNELRNTNKSSTIHEEIPLLAQK